MVPRIFAFCWCFKMDKFKRFFNEWLLSLGPQVFFALGLIIIPPVGASFILVPLVAIPICWYRAESHHQRLEAIRAEAYQLAAMRRRATATGDRKLLREVELAEKVRDEKMRRSVERLLKSANL